MWLKKHFSKYTHQIHSFLKFYWEAKTLYNIHSPLLFDLITYIEQLTVQDRRDINRIQELRKQLMNNKSIIFKSDLGAGSRSLNNNLKTTVKKSYKSSSSKSHKAILLFKIAQYFKPKTILELGTHLGIGSALLSNGSPSSKITTVEGDPIFHALAKQNIQSLGLSNIIFINDNFDDYLHGNNKSLSQDMVFIDGNHTYEATMRYFLSCYNSRLEHQVIIFDDIYWSTGMTQAWQQIQNQVVHGYCIDFFNIGIVINSSQIDNVIKIKYVSKMKKPLSFGFWG